jgi:hypothetical protein
MRENKDSNEEQKYEILAQKEKEISDFMLKFEEEKDEYEKEIKDNQYVIA